MAADFSKIGRSNVARSKDHERRVAKLFTKWSGVQFRRRRVEGREDAVRIVELTSDVIPVSGDFMFVIEAKCGKGFSMEGMLGNPVGCLFTEWWHQCCFDASLLTADFHRRVYPLMVFKPRPQNDWIAISSDAFRFLTPQKNIVCPTKHNSKHQDLVSGDVWFPHFRFDTYENIGPVPGNVSHSKKNKKIVPVQLDPVVLCRWKDFSINIDPQSMFVPGISSSR